jgi:hypothetical protein
VGAFERLSDATSDSHSATPSHGIGVGLSGK